MTEEWKTCAFCGERNPISNQYCGACGKTLDDMFERANIPRENIARVTLGAALLNLNGLGLGYLLLKRWLRWAIHFGTTIALIVIAYTTQASSLPILWAIIFSLWLMWMGVDGWLQARRPTASTPNKILSRRWLPVAAVALILIEGTGLWVYSALGQREFASGMTAYEANDCRTAMQHFNRVTTHYELTLSRNIVVADSKIEECSLLVFAQNAYKRGEYADAVAAYETHLRLYAGSPLIAATQEAVAEVYGNWAAKLSQAGDYQSAIGKYEAILGSYANTLASGQARELAARTFTQWARQLRDDGNYSEAIQKYETILDQYHGTSACAEVESSLPELYSEWASALYGQGHIKEALQTYHDITIRFPGASVAADAEQAIADLYAEAAQALDEGYPCDAVPLLDAFVQQLASEEANASLPQALYDCGRERHSASDYSEASDLYGRIIDEYPSSPLIEDATLALEAVETDQRCSRFSGEKKEVGPFSPSGYSSGDATRIDVINDAQEMIEVLFCAGSPDSRSVQVAGCPECKPYSSSPRRPRDIAPEVPVSLAPGTYEMLVLCGDCASPLTEEALHYEWYLAGGEEYTVYHYVVRKSTYPFPIPSLPPIVIPTFELPDLPILLTPSAP